MKIPPRYTSKNQFANMLDGRATQLRALGLRIRGGGLAFFDDKQLAVQNVFNAASHLNDAAKLLRK